jgi:hypothetical protein
MAVLPFNRVTPIYTRENGNPSRRETRATTLTLVGASCSGALAVGYSLLNAAVGSMRAARHAGSQQAAADTRASNTTTPPYVSGSSDVTP